MKLTLICSGGMSTSWIVNKIKEYASENEPDLQLNAFGLLDYLPAAKEADVILLGPQIGYYKEKIAHRTGKPVDVISSKDYATANIAGIVQQAKALISS